MMAEMKAFDADHVGQKTRSAQGADRGDRRRGQPMSQSQATYMRPDQLYPEPPPEPPRRGERSSVPVVDAAIRGYEEAWPDRIWAEAPEVHQRVWIEVMALHYVERTGPFAEDGS